jgi:hypothetical protein
MRSIVRFHGHIPYITCNVAHILAAVTQYRYVWLSVYDHVAVRPLASDGLCPWCTVCFDSVFEHNPEILDILGLLFGNMRSPLPTDEPR